MSEFKPIQSASAGQYRRLAEQGNRAAAAKAAIPMPKLAKGDAVNLVHAQLGHIPAKIVAIKGGGRIDLETVDDDPLTNVPLRITNAPYDPDGQKFDSWHVPESKPSSPPAAAAGAGSSSGPTGGKAA
jgi:hypothetical protein